MMRRGYTLIEMIIVSMLIALLATLALPFFSNQGPARVAAGHERLWHDLLDAQAWSIANPTAPATVTFAKRSYVVQRGSDSAAVLFGREDFEEADGVTLSTAGFAGNAITFSHSGAVQGSPGATPPVITLTSEDGRTSMAIQITPTSGELRTIRASQ
jgi:prepilin-type N-terminal cleavage/methylation domain-containing protein